MLKGFPPLIAKEPYIMILGSMPSVTSLDKHEYYGFKHNRFWKIMHHIFQMPIATYEEKQEIILQHHILLWDVIGKCEREGSLDSNIKNEEVNDIATLVQEYPSIQMIVCNGRKSYDLYQKHFSQLPISCIYLPSTSNANRSINEEMLFMKWEQALAIIKIDNMNE